MPPKEEDPTLTVHIASASDATKPTQLLFQLPVEPMTTSQRVKTMAQVAPRESCPSLHVEPRSPTATGGVDSESSVSASQPEDRTQSQESSADVHADATQDTMAQQNGNKSFECDKIPRRPILKTTSSWNGPPTCTEERPTSMCRRSVSFNSISIREYDQTIGDHPCCSYGPPVMLDWNYSDEHLIDVDEYEGNRPPRRGLRNMLLNYYHRRNLLMFYYSHTEEEIKKGTREVKKSKLQRTLTKKFLPVMKVEEAVASVGRKTQRVIHKKKMEQKMSEKELLAKYA